MTKKFLSLAVITRTLLAGVAGSIKDGTAGRKPVTIDIPRYHLFTPISEKERDDLLKLNAIRTLKFNETEDMYPVWAEEAADHGYAAREAEQEMSQQQNAQRQAEQANREAADRRIKEAAARQRLAEERAANEAAAAREQQALDNERTAEGLEETEEDRQRKAAIAARFAAESGDTDPLVAQPIEGPDGTEGEADDETDLAHEDVQNGEDDMNEGLEEQEEPAKEPVEETVVEPVKGAEAPKTATTKKTTPAKKTAPAKKPVAAKTADADEDSVV